MLSKKNVPEISTVEFKLTDKQTVEFATLIDEVEGGNILEKMHILGIDGLYYASEIVFSKEEEKISISFSQNESNDLAIENMQVLLNEIENNGVQYLNLESE